jgi:hypothetical protein
MSFRFGIEIEFLLGSLTTQNTSQGALLKEVKDRLREAGIKSTASKCNDHSEERYKTWSITTEVTVLGEPSQHLRTYLKSSSSLFPQDCFIPYVLCRSQYEPLFTSVLL